MKNKGFTLIEILVSVGIIIFLTALFLSNYKSGQEQFALERSSYKLAQDIRKVQEMAMSMKEENCSPSGIVTGFGLYFDKSSSENDKYILFGECTGNKTRQPSDNNTEIFLEKGVKISEVKKNGGGGNKISIFFIPPDPIFYVDGNTGKNIEVILSNSLGESKTIKVNTIGMVEIE
ncbi:hypothetical protein AMJ49_04690 [Parcubacteria bacterium DG_74_2]|nr:MAG: hypothetical protein AMJ49_04690 [Parcubacteria bacterium DG_74_2]